MKTFMLLSRCIQRQIQYDLDWRIIAMRTGLTLKQIRRMLVIITLNHHDGMS